MITVFQTGKSELHNLRLTESYKHLHT